VHRIPCHRAGGYTLEVPRSRPSRAAAGSASPAWQQLRTSRGHEVIPAGHARVSGRAGTGLLVIWVPEWRLSPLRHPDHGKASPGAGPVRRLSEAGANPAGQRSAVDNRQIITEIRRFLDRWMILHVRGWSKVHSKFQDHLKFRTYPGNLRRSSDARADSTPADPTPAQNRRPRKPDARADSTPADSAPADSGPACLREGQRAQADQHCRTPA
jgi:hypothetical protein